MAKIQIIYSKLVSTKVTPKAHEQLLEIVASEKAAGNAGVCKSDVVRKAIEQYLAKFNEKQKGDL